MAIGERTHRLAEGERLTFGHEAANVPSHDRISAALMRSVAPTFATVRIAEPREWGYFGLFAFTAALLARPQDHVRILSSLHLAEVFAVVGIAPMLLHRFVRGRPMFRVTRETAALLLFGVAILASAPFSIWPGGTMNLFTNLYLKVLVVFVLMMNTLTTPRRIERITGLIVLCCGLIALESVGSYLRGTNLVEGDRLNGPVGGLFGNPNDLAMNMVTFLPSAAVIALTARHSAFRRMLAAGIAVLMLATIVFTKSRGGALGLTAALLTLLILGRRIRPRFTAMALAAVLVGMPFVPPTYWNRMMSIVDDSRDKREFTGSRETRWNVMTEGVKAFVDRPLTGVGAGVFAAYNPAGRKERWNETHNALIQVAAETGIVGLLIFGYLIVRGWMAAVRLRRLLEPPRRGKPDVLAEALSPDDRSQLYSHSVAMTAGIVGWFVCSLFASVAYSWTFYYILALTVAARELVYDRLRAARTIVAERQAATSVVSRSPAPQPRGDGAVAFSLGGFPA